MISICAETHTAQRRRKSRPTSAGAESGAGGAGAEAEADYLGWSWRTVCPGAGSCCRRPEGRAREPTGEIPGRPCHAERLQQCKHANMYKDIEQSYRRRDCDAVILSPPPSSLKICIYTFYLDRAAATIAAPRSRRAPYDIGKLRTTRRTNSQKCGSRGVRTRRLAPSSSFAPGVDDRTPSNGTRRSRPKYGGLGRSRRHNSNKLIVSGTRLGSKRPELFIAVNHEIR